MTDRTDSRGRVLYPWEVLPGSTAPAEKASDPQPQADHKPDPQPEGDAPVEDAPEGGESDGDGPADAAPAENPRTDGSRFRRRPNPSPLPRR